MKKIGSKIMLTIMACSVVISLWIGSTSTFQSSKVIKKEIHDKLILMSQSYANAFSQTFKKVEGAVGSLSSTAFSMFDVKRYKEDKEYLKEYQNKIESVIQRIAETSDGVQAVYFTFNPQLTGEVYEIWYADKEGDGKLIKIDSDPKGDYIEDFYPTNEEMHWYYDPIIRGEGVWSDPSEEIDLNKEMVSYTEPIYKDGILVGVIGMDIDIDAIKKTIKNMKVYNTGYAFIMNDSYNVIIYPYLTKDDDLKHVENGNSKLIAEQMDKKFSGVIAYQFKGEDKLLSYTRLSNRWILAFALPKDEIFKPMNNLTAIIFILTLLAIILSAIAAVIFSRRFSNPINCAVEQLKLMELGDFTKEIPKDLLDREDDLGTFIKSVDSMQHVIKDLMGKVNHSSNIVKNSTDFLVEIKEQTQAASSQAAAAIEKIAINKEKEEINKKRMEKQLEKINTRLLEAQSFGHIGNWEWDIENDKIWISEEMYRIMGLKQNELELTPHIILTHIHSEDKEYVKKAMRDTLYGKGYSIEFRFIDFQGKQKWIYHRGDVVHDEESSGTHLFGISQDITEKKELLDVLKKMNENLKEMVNKEVHENRKKDAVMIYQARHARMGQMIGNIAHQWKQPLNNLNLILSNLKDAYEYRELNKAYMESSINTSKKILNQMSQTIDDFRWFFKPRKNKEKFLLGDAISFALELLEESVKRNNIKVEMHGVDDIRVYGYSNEFSQVVFNILNNAKDALIEKKVENKKIEIKVYAENKKSVIEICNNGGSIEESIMDKIFEPYFTTKEEEKGTGIGLYMSKMIMEKHMNGKIEFENIQDGVCCKIMIPNDGVNENGKL